MEEKSQNKANPNTSLVSVDKISEQCEHKDFIFQNTSKENLGVIISLRSKNRERKKKKKKKGNLYTCIS